MIAAGANIKLNLIVRINFLLWVFHGILSFIFKWFGFNSVNAYQRTSEMIVSSFNHQAFINFQTGCGAERLL